MQSKWRALAQLEHVTGLRMADVLEAHGEALNATDTIEVGDDVVDRYAKASHQDAMTQMQGVVEKAIIHFDQLLAVAPESDVRAVQFLVQHEQALLTFVERELAGKSTTSLDDVQILLTAEDNQ